MKTTIRVVIVAFFLFLVSRAIAADNETCTTTSASTSTQYLNVALTLKILLVDFDDVPARSQYTRADFENMLLSLGSYVVPATTPDGDPVYGSLHDYFNKMSSGNVVITGRIVNRRGPGNRPIWLRMPSWGTKANFDQGLWAFGENARSVAAFEGLDVSTPDPFTFLTIIYAGNTYYCRQIFPGQFRGCTLNPQVPFPGAQYYIMSELWGSPANQENPTDKFARIGGHCHEFAHLLGIGHSSGSRADLMQAGYKNGNTTAPAPISPVYRALKGWTNPIVITGQQPFDMYYSLVSPAVFRINSNFNSDYFIVENRRFNQSMTIGTAVVPDYNNGAFFPPAWPHGTIAQGIFVWRVMGGTPSDYGDNGLLYASGRCCQTWPEGTPSETDDAIPFPGYRDVRVLSPWSDSRDPYDPEANPPNIFVPNTQRGSNVGMEVLSENQAQGYFHVMLYQVAPESASPSMPQNLQVGIYAGGGHANPRLTWTAMQEPDVISNGYIHVERRTKPLYSPWSAWSVVGTVAGNLSEFIDFTIQQACQGSCPDSVQYRIRARDNTQNYSMYSDVVSKTYYFYKIFPTGNTAEIPDKFELLQNYPNPFNPTTALTYALPKDAHVSLSVLDILGREVLTLIDEFQKAGRYTVPVDANHLASGIYIYRIQAGAFADVKRMLLLK